MLLQRPEEIKVRANRIAKGLKKEVKTADIAVLPDTSRAGGGSLPEIDLPTYIVSIRSEKVPVNEFEERLRKGNPPIIARIRENSLIIDARTVQEKDYLFITSRVKDILQP